MVKPYGPRRTDFLLLGRLSLEVQTPSSVMFMGVIMGISPINTMGL